jgi:hypothetical protein
MKNETWEEGGEEILDELGRVLVAICRLLRMDRTRIGGREGILDRLSGFAGKALLQSTGEGFEMRFTVAFWDMIRTSPGRRVHTRRTDGTPLT